MQRPTSDSTNTSGSIVVTILYVMLFLSTLLFGLVILANANLQRAYQRIFLLQAQYSAESGADAALAVINSGTSFTGTTSDVTVVSNTLYKATYATTISSGSSGSQQIITATGKVYRPATATTPTYTRRLRVTVTLSSTTTASSVMSRNIIDVDSSIKNLQATSIYANGYVNMRSGSTNLIFSSLTIAGRDTASPNCSLEGSGHPVRSSSLPAGTKATIDLAFNNCITPPGNTSTTDFAITANDAAVTPIQSTYIPWSTYMDSSYQASPSGCADWTAAGTTINIPSTGNTKKTHYPDSSSGVASTCGTNGSLALGTKTYTILDNIHVRASFCAASACDPTFNNTTGSIKYVFIEGSINFNSLHTSAGSAPIVFVTYGADPGTHNTKCPFGDSIFLNKNGNTGTAAPAAYLLATNGVCLYQTKFDANPALGGIGGKNLYVASNSGNPFDLALDPNFPVASIPVNLTWRATGYERL